MEIDPVIFWNVVLTLIIAPAVWAFRNMMAEIKRIDILLNRTREDYASRAEVRDEMQHVMEALHRLEDKLDRVLSIENSVKNKKSYGGTSPKEVLKQITYAKKRFLS